MSVRWRWFIGIYAGSVIAYALIVGALQLVVRIATHGH